MNWIWLLYWLLIGYINTVNLISILRVREADKMLKRVDLLIEASNSLRALGRHGEAFAKLDEADLLLQDAKEIETGWLAIARGKPKHRTKVAA